MENKTERWTFNSPDGDIWGNEDFATKGEAIEAGREYYTGSYNHIEIGKIGTFHPKIDAESILDSIIENAYEECGEVAEDYLCQLSKEHEERLEELLNQALSQWLKETENYPTFYPIENIETIEI